MDAGGIMIICILLALLGLGVVNLIYNIKWNRFMNYYTPILITLAEEELCKEVLY